MSCPSRLARRLARCACSPSLFTGLDIAGEGDNEDGDCADSADGAGEFAAKKDTSHERPFLTLQPFIIFHIICICKERIKGQEGDRIDVCPERCAYVQGGTRDLGRVYLDRCPGVRVRQ